MRKECRKIGGICPYWSDLSVAARQMTNLIDTNLAELTNFCSGNHPNTKDRVQLGALVDMENTIPGMQGMAKMIKFQIGVIPGVDELFQTHHSETEEDVEIFRDIDISERFAGTILASSRYHRLIKEILGTGATLPQKTLKVKDLVMNSLKHYTKATQIKAFRISQDASMQWTRTRHKDRDSTNFCESAVLQVITVTPMINLGSGATYFKNENGQFISAKTAATKPQKWNSWEEISESGVDHAKSQEQQ